MSSRQAFCGSFRFPAILFVEMCGQWNFSRQTRRGGYQTNSLKQIMARTKQTVRRRTDPAPPVPAPPTRGSPTPEPSSPARDDSELQLIIGKERTSFTITMSPLQRVEDLRAKVAAKNSCPTNDMQLQTEDGRYLADGKTLDFYDLPQSARILPKKRVSGELTVDDAIASLSEMKGKCKGVDVCFAFDTTGSMNCYIQEVRKQVRETCQRLMEDIDGMRISIMGVADYCDQMSSYVIHTLDFSADPSDIESFVRGVGGTFGGDFPECYEWALHKANRLSWRDGEEGIAKAFVMIADAVPHPPSYSTAHCSWQEELGKLADRGVKVYGVQASANSSHLPFYARLAERSGGLHLTFKSFDLITRMFLAVCYREAGRLGEYEEEGRRGARGKEMGEILDRLGGKDENKETESKIVCSESWFKETREQAKGKIPKYYYDPKRDMFFCWSPQKYSEDVEGMRSKGLEGEIDEQFRVRKWGDLMTDKDKNESVFGRKMATSPKKAASPKKAKSPRTPKKAVPPKKAKTPPPSSSSSDVRKRKRVVSEDGVVGGGGKKAKKEKGVWERVSSDVLKEERDERLRKRRDREKDKEEKGEKPKVYYWHY